MKKTVIFRNGKQVLALGQGTWRMGQSASRRHEEIETLRRGVELGMNLIDTAELYDNEEFVGEALQGIREQVYLVSKVLPSNASREGIARACERSLRKLQTDHLDLYLLHWGGRYPFEETVEGMTRLQQQGKIAGWGVSNMDVAQMEEFFALPEGDDCLTDQVAYNLETRGTEYDLIPWCHDRKMPVMAYSPLGEGNLVHSALLSDIGRRHNASAVQIALAWAVRNPGIIAIPKASTPKHVEDNFRSLSIELTPEDLRELNSTYPAPTRKVPLMSW